MLGRSKRAMSLRRPAAAVAVAVFAVLTAGEAASQGAAGPKPVAARPPAAPIQERDNVWAQTYLPRPADPTVRFGALANGMRYAVTHSASPAGVASFRLRVAAGSIDETDDQRGLAHFLEHMAFKGSAHVPGDSMIKTLERMGLSFGADTNAGTSVDQTVFKLDLPKSDAADLATALMLLREQMSELTLSQADMDSERGVVLSEERLRDTPGYRSSVGQLDFLLEGQRAPGRQPIGDVQVLKTAPVSRIRDFYAKWYRPEAVTLVVAGDFDPDAMVAQIKAKFSDWTNPTPAPPAPPLGPVKVRGPAVKLFVGEGVSPAVHIDWVAPYDDSADTLAHERQTLVREIALAVLNRRLADLAAGANPPFIGAGAALQSIYDSADLTGVSLSVRRDAWREGLSAGLAEVRRLQTFGVAQSEVDRELTETRAGLVSQAAGAATRRSTQLADALISSASENTVYTSPAQSLADFDAEVKGLTAAEVSASVKPLFSGSGPLVFVSAPQAIPGGEATVRSALDAAMAAPVTAPKLQAAAVWPYAHLGPPAHVVARREVKDLGVTFATLSNGVRVTVKPTAFRKDQVLVSVRFGHGRQGLPLDRPSPVWALPSFISQGGTRELTHEQIERIAASRLESVSFSIGDDAYALNGATRPADLAFEMQKLAAILSRPGFRPEVFARTQAAASQVLDRIDSTPSGVLSRDFGVLSHSGDLRWQALPDRAQLQAATAAQVRRLIEPAMAGEPLEVAVVGDVTVDQALKLAAQTFGALPRRHGPTKPAVAGLETRFPAAGSVERIDRGRADQAVALIAWKTQGLFDDPQEARALGMAAEVLQLRLFDTLRAKEGSTYSPGAASTNSEVFPGYGFLYAQVETPPAKIANFFAEADRLVADLAAKGPTPDELDRAKRPRVQERVKIQQTNEYWLGTLGRAQSDPRDLQMARDLVSGAEKVTAADVQAAAAKFLVPAREWRMVVHAAEPKPGAAAETPIAPTQPLRPPTVRPGPPPPGPSKTGAVPASADPAPSPSAPGPSASPTH